MIDKAASETELDNFINMIIKGDLQKEIKKDISKIYPVGDLEIRKTEVLEKGKKK